MNDNIKRLALLCGAWTQVYENKFGQKLMMIDSNFDYEKFAELIVNDCIGFLYPQLNEKYTPEELLHQAKYRNLIKEHFGVNNEI